jgi:hypothetical protein
MKNDQGILFDVAMIGPAFLKGPVCCTFLPLNQRQKKIGSREPERLLVKNAYSPYRPIRAGQVFRPKDGFAA